EEDETQRRRGLVTTSTGGAAADDLPRRRHQLASLDHLDQFRPGPGRFVVELVNGHVGNGTILDVVERQDLTLTAGQLANGGPELGRFGTETPMRNTSFPSKAGDSPGLGRQPSST